MNNINNLELFETSGCLIIFIKKKIAERNIIMFNCDGNLIA